MDWLTMLIELLQTGVKIEINIQAKQPEKPEAPAFKMIPAQCKTCGWYNNYNSLDQAKKGLNAKRQHCTRDDCPKYPQHPQWLINQMQEDAQE
jgi:predicted Zn-ribbon and HTH transcriptional regulator